jgi:hypothetical protein
MDAVMRIAILTSIVLGGVSVLPSILHAEDARVVYEARYQTTGYLLRAASACTADKQQIDASFVLVSSDEMKAFSRAFPQLTERWMTNGANLFNTSVMKQGLQRACDYALATLKKANSSR